MSFENSKSGDPEVVVTSWTMKVNKDGEVARANAHPCKDLTDEEREQVREGLRRERLPFSSSVLTSPASMQDWVEHHSSHEIALVLSAADTTRVAFENAHRYLEERLHHTLREREVLERDLKLVEKKLTAATLDNVQLQKAADEWQGLYAELEKKYKLECAKKNPCGEQANEPMPSQPSAQPSTPPAAPPAPSKPIRSKTASKIRKAWDKE